MPVKIVKCRILDHIWRVRAGDTINLQVDKARRLQGQGKVEILDPVDENIKTEVKTYKTKVLTANDNSYLTKKHYSNKKKYKIAWVQDYSKDGGAEISNKFVVNIGETLGYDIVGITPAHINVKIIEQSDLIVINNFFEFPQDKAEIILRYLYEKRKPYIKYDHDHREMKRRQFSRQLFALSKLNVFLSPLHKEKTLNVVGKYIENKSIVLPLAIDTKLFTKTKKNKHEKNTVLVPTFKKCGMNIVEYIKKNPDKKYTIIDQPNINIDSKAKIEIVKKSSLLDMVNLYQSHEYMLHLPISFWAGERIYFEALLCGCKPMVNDNVGHYSWNIKTINLKKWLYEAPYKFWSHVESLLEAL